MDSYDHLYRECPVGRGPESSQRHRNSRNQEHLVGTSIRRTCPEAELLLKLYEEPGSYMVALGDLTRCKKFRLRVVKTGLDHPSDREALATFIRQIRQLNMFREVIWEERRHTPSIPSLDGGQTSFLKGRSGSSLLALWLVGCAQTTIWHAIDISSLMREAPRIPS